MYILKVFDNLEYRFVFDYKTNSLYKLLKKIEKIETPKNDEFEQPEYNTRYSIHIFYN